MKTLAKKLLATLIVVLAVLAISAQPGRGCKPHFEGNDTVKFAKRLDFMEKKLGLSADQKTKIKAIHVKHMADIAPILKAHEAQMIAFRAEMEQERDKFQVEIKALLNDQQKSKFDTLMSRKDGKEHKGIHKGEGKKGKHGKRCCCCLDK